jgi:hypothetical protein
MKVPVMNGVKNRCKTAFDKISTTYALYIYLLHKCTYLWFYVCVCKVKYISLKSTPPFLILLIHSVKYWIFIQNPFLWVKFVIIINQYIPFVTLEYQKNAVKWKQLFLQCIWVIYIEIKGSSGLEFLHPWFSTYVVCFCSSQ